MLSNKFQILIENKVKKDEFSGAVLVTNDSNFIFEFFSGYANLEKKIPNSIDTIFNIGSMDKMFTAVAIVQLEDQKKLRFQDTIHKFLPDYPKEIADKVTIHHLLTHTEGFPSYFNRKYIDMRLELKTVNDYLSLFKNEPLLFEPGEKYQYSNSAYVVLGAIIEKVTGKSYYEYIKEYIFDMAEMEHSGSLSLDNEEKANGYTFRKPYSQDATLDERRNNRDELPSRGSPAGGGYSTCSDLHNFSKSLLQFRLLNEEKTKLLLIPKEKVGSKENTTLYYGYGFQILDFGEGHYRYGHAGAFAGVNARLDMYPWLGYTVVVLSNYDQPAAFTVANEIGELLLAEK